MLLPVLTIYPGEQRRIRYSIRIAESSQIVFDPIHIADERNLYDKHSIDIEFSSFATDRDAFASTVAGKADMATVFINPVVKWILRNEIPLEPSPDIGLKLLNCPNRIEAQCE